MRKRQAHTVPLGRQAVKVLQDLRPFTGGSWYVFPGHATALTMLHEALGFILEAIEAQFGHRVPDRLGTAYNRTQHIDKRKRMMQAWVDYLDGLK